MPDKDIVDKKDQSIQEGDFVSTNYRKGEHEGRVEKIVTDADEASEENVNVPPKVIKEDQYGKKTAHNPNAVEKTQEMEGAKYY